MQDIEHTRIGYIPLKRIKYQLHETFDVIKSNPMDLNLLMEHVARLTSSVAIMSEYLADLEAEREQDTVCPQCNAPLLYMECSHCGFDTSK